MINLVIELAFGALFLGALFAFIRRPRRLELDVLLVFGTVALLFALQAVRLLGVTLPAFVQVLGASALIAHAPLSLRLAGDLAPVPRLLRVGSWVVFLAIAFGLTFATTVPAVFLVAIGYFAVVDGIAAFVMAGGARRRGGAAQIRLWAAAVATGLIALTLLVLGGSLAKGDIGRVATVAAEVGALGSVAAYLAAFLPPRWLRGLWQSRSALKGTQRLLESAPRAESGAWSTFADLAVKLSGADGAVVFVGREGGTGTRVAAAGLVATEPSIIPEEAWTAALELPPSRRDDPLPNLPEPFGGLAHDGWAAAATVLPIPSSGDERAVAVLLHRYQSLFGDDEQALMLLLGSQAATLAERAQALSKAAALSERLSHTVEALRSASKAKSDFLASMSHELRTPLNAILGFSDLMRSEPAEGDRRSVPVEWIEHVNTAGRHLLDLINDVLDLSKVEAGRIELHPSKLDLNLAVGEALAGLRPLADRKHLTVTSELSADGVVADPGRFRQMLYNLLSNAIKYTPDGGSVTVTSTLVGHEPSAEVHLAVTDTGVGIAPQDASRVFEEFTQVGDLTTRQEGTGLGLALTRRLVEAHGGRLELISELGRGSTFTIVLPAPHEQRAPASDAPLLAPTFTSSLESDGVHQVLLIEDDAQAVDLITRYLQPTGYRLVSAANGIDGIAAARRLRPRAILLDVQLPDIDGWEVLRRMKADPELRDIPVVVVTVVDERELGLALGASDYLLKPVEREALVGALDRCLTTSRGAARILAIDDDPATLTFLRAVLEPDVATLLTASSGRAGLEMARAGDLDLVICDLVMPEIDGFEVIAQLKASPKTSGTPILVLTGHELSELDKERLNGRVAGYCQKGPNAGVALRHWLAETVVRDVPESAFASSLDA
jgi:signal transduction histidine kinase/CheY-like chemotaxis protein